MPIGTLVVIVAIALVAFGGTRWYNHNQELVEQAAAAKLEAFRVEVTDSLRKQGLVVTDMKPELGLVEVQSKNGRTKTWAHLRKSEDDAYWKAAVDCALDLNLMVVDSDCYVGSTKEP